MKIWNNISDFNVKNAVLTIGSFDGVHIGHIKVINQLIALAKKVDGESVVFTFLPHPVTVMNPNKEIIFLTTIEEKKELFRNSGIDHLIIFPFTKDFARLTYTKFVENILVKQLKINTLLIGYDNKLGRNREGDYELLFKLSKKLNFNLEKQDELKLNNSNVSSTKVRELLRNDELFEASKILGYFYSISGKIVFGQQLGTKIGFPTANLLPPKDKFIPNNGVYAILVIYKNKRYRGIMNIGFRPTVNSDTNKVIIEVHIFNFNENLYGKVIKISIIEKLRNERKFASIYALMSQIKKDKEIAIRILQNKY